MQAITSQAVFCPRAQVKRVSKVKAAARSNFLGSGIKGITATSKPAAFSRKSVAVRAEASEDRQSVNIALNGDPFIGMLETPVTSAPIVSNFLSQLPVYRTGVSPVSRGVEIGLTHGFFLTGPFIKLGPCRTLEQADLIGCLSAGGLVVILTLCLTIYGQATFQNDNEMSKKTLSGRPLEKDELQTSDGWAGFTAGWLVGGLSGCAWAYLLTQVLPYYA